VEQDYFLSSLGIKERAERLVAKAGAGDEETKKRLEGGWKRLVDRGPTGMGRIYKAMAIVPYRKGSEVRRPVGFGGQVVG
jgi:SAM-dependent MidA family methyltransferase